MMKYKTSTKTRPLLFFESFVNNDSLKKYEDYFYNNPINPSQLSFKKLGYITYTKDLYEGNEPFKPVTVYFKSNLEGLLKAQVNLTNKLLVERRDELEYQNTKADIFLNKQLIRIHNLKVGCESITVYKELIRDVLNTLESNIKVIGNDLIKSNPKLAKVLTSSSYFDPLVNRRILITLYDIASENRLINDEEILEEDFLNIFMSNSPENLKENIRFISNNQVATFFFNSIMVLFNNLSHSTIVKSKSFYKKSGDLFKQGDLDQAKLRYLKKGLNKDFLDIQKAIEKITPKNS